MNENNRSSKGHCYTLKNKQSTNAVNQTSSYLKSQHLSLHNCLSSLFHSTAFHSNCLIDKSPDGNPHPCGERWEKWRRWVLCGNSEEGGGIVLLQRLLGGGERLGMERAKNAEAIRKERQTQTDRDQRKAIYALTNSTTPWDNDRLRSSIKGCLDDATEKNSMFVQRSVKSFSKCLWMGRWKIIWAKLFFHNSPKINYILGAVMPFFMCFKFLFAIYCTQK